mmetsp:Transcript_533/g.917  ORF Transcript_533/g.917 Transcript_533/m.917 type:complete len:228 (-) Transcript_533:2508-3191(-)
MIGSSTSSTLAFCKVSCSLPRRRSRVLSSELIALLTRRCSACASLNSFWVSFDSASTCFSCSVACASASSASASDALASATFSRSSASHVLASSSFSFRSLRRFFWALIGFLKSRLSSYSFWEVSFARCSRIVLRFFRNSSRALPTASSYARKSRRPVSSRKGAKYSSSAFLTVCMAAFTAALAFETSSSAFSRSASSFFTRLVVEAKREVCSFNLLEVYSRSLFMY